MVPIFLYVASTDGPLQQVGKPFFALQILPSFGIPKCRLNLSAMAYDPSIEKEIFHFSFTPSGNFIWIKPFKCLKKTFPPTQDRYSAQTGLKTLKHKNFPQDLAIIFRHAPFAVMILIVDFIGSAQPHLFDIPPPVKLYKILSKIREKCICSYHIKPDLSKFLGITREKRVQQRNADIDLT